MNKYENESPLTRCDAGVFYKLTHTKALFALRPILLQDSNVQV